MGDSDTDSNQSAPGTTMDNESYRLPKSFVQNTGWRRVVQNFTPAWFAVTMGTGIVPVLLLEFGEIYPSYYSPLRTMSIVFFILNVVLFVIISTVTILRYTLYPGTWKLMIRHPVQSLFIGTLPMGFATIINMFVHICVEEWGDKAAYVAWGMWWVDAAISLAGCVGLPFQMMTKHDHRHETMTAAWLLPVVAPIVVAASGGTVASVLPNPNHALLTCIAGYVLWGTGLPFAFVVMTIYFHRLVIHRLPPQEVIVSVFLPIGPLGQGGFSLMTIGTVAREVFPATGALHPMAGEIIYILGFMVALVLWGFGLVWGFFAVASVGRRKFPFNMGWWGFTFPTGIYAMSTMTLGRQLPSAFFKIFGTIIGISEILLWLIVAGGTVKHMIKGTLFEAPCLKEMEKLKRETDAERERDTP